MAQDLANQTNNLIDPTDRILAVVPNDDNDLPFKCKAIYVGVAGDLAIHNHAGTSVILKDLQAGIWHPMRTSRILDTGTATTVKPQVRIMY